MTRSPHKPSDIFTKVIADARDELILDASKAAQFAQSGIKGDERSASLRKFIDARLPTVFAVGKGEVIDYRDHRTGQIDLFIYDKASCGPLSIQSENVLIPCESLYVVIEVKSLLTQDELNTCYCAARKVRSLRPFKAPFIAPRTRGRGAADGAARCLYIVFAYSTNVAKGNWAQKEFDRVQQSASIAACPLDVVDLIVVLNRGLINPGKKAAKPIAAEPLEIFMEFYLHVMNFISRERPRRRMIDWQTYSARIQRHWGPLKLLSP